MKKHLSTIIAVLILCLWSHGDVWADSKVTDLGAITDLQGTDVFLVIDDPGGSAASKKITATSVFTAPTITTSATVQALTGAGAYLNLIADAGEDDSDSWRVYIQDGPSLYIQSYESGGWLSTFSIEKDTGPIIYGKDDADSANLTFFADQGDDNADYWRIATADEADLTIETYESGGYVAAVTLTNAGVLTTTTLIGAVDSAGTVSANLFTPDAADDADIGTVDLEFSDIYFSDSAVIYGQANQSATLTSSDSTWTASNFAVTGTLGITGALTISAGALTDNTVTSDDIHWDEPITVPFDKKLQFGDTGIYIWADDDHKLDIVSYDAIEDTYIESASTYWAHTGNLTATTYGAAAVTDTELGYLDTVSSNIQDQLDNITPGTGTEDHLVRWDAANAIQDSIVIITDAGAMTGLTSVSVDPSTEPTVEFNDSSAVGADAADKLAGQIVMDMTTATEDTEVTDINIQAQTGGGVNSIIAEWDGSEESWIFGDAATGEDIKIDLSTANTITVTSPGGGTAIDFSALALTTTGITSGGVKTVVDANPADGEIDAYCYGGVFFASGTGTAVLPPVAVNMQVTVENHTADDVWIDPDASEVIRLNGVALTGGHRILGTDLGDGCVLTYYSAGVWSAFCSGYATAGS